ncbi:MAG TPA: flavin reductase family protein [Acidimicrobiales bacterium]|nr:flavin reductase family protein [Acidimicrobiales bacterium]
MGDDAFDAIVGSLDSAMAVVTTAVAGERAGCLVGFHTQSSIEPRRYSVWLSKANHTYRVGLRATHLGVHLLTAADTALAERFGTLSGDDTDKFAGLAVTTGPGDVPLLDDLPHRLVVRRTVLVDEGGDHVCVVGEPVEVASTGPFTPLRLAAVAHLRPGHEAEERPAPATQRAAEGGRPLTG